MRMVWSTPGLLWIGFVSFTAFFARTGGLFNVVPLLAEDEMQLSPGQIGFGLGLISIAGLLFTIPAGTLVDRLGRKPVIVPSALLSATAMLVFAFAPNFGWYIIACAWWGTASGISGAAPAAYAADTARAGETAATLGGYRMIADSGYVLGPLLLGAIADVISPEAALWFCTLLSLLAGLGFWRFAPETFPRSRLRGDHPPDFETRPVPPMPSTPGSPAP
jgi:MFS family permease